LEEPNAFSGSHSNNLLHSHNILQLLATTHISGWQCFYLSKLMLPFIVSYNCVFFSLFELKSGQGDQQWEQSELLDLL